MKQRRSYSRLFYHIAFSTKNREHLIADRRDGQIIFGFLKTKAHDLDAFIEEFGCWHDHIHLLVRTSPTVAPATLYGQLKGFSTRAWNKRNTERVFGWQNGVYIATVDPDHDEQLRSYIREQWKHHDQRTTLANWEPME